MPISSPRWSARTLSPPDATNSSNNTASKPSISTSNAVQRQSDDLICFAGHRGLVGSAVVRALEVRGFNDLLTRSHAELDPTDQAATEEVRRFVGKRGPARGFPDRRPAAHVAFVAVFSTPRAGTIVALAFMLTAKYGLFGVIIGWIAGWSIAVTAVAAIVLLPSGDRHQPSGWTGRARVGRTVVLE